MDWSGVMPAMTTPFDTNMKVDHRFLAQHAAWQLGNGCQGLVMLGSLGEGATSSGPTCRRHGTGRLRRPAGGSARRRARRRGPGRQARRESTAQSCGHPREEQNPRHVARRGVSDLPLAGKFLLDWRG